MPKIILDPEKAMIFQQAEDLTQVCLPDGRILGYFQPSAATSHKIEPPIPMAELLRRAQEDGLGRPLQEILRDLEAKG